jgi:hypothetical protein
MRVEYTGFFGILILIADLYAIVSVVSSNRSVSAKVLWILLVLLLPVLGWIIWFFFGPRAKS